MNDQDRKRIEDIMALVIRYGAIRSDFDGDLATVQRVQDTLDDLEHALIDRERVATREDVERVAEAIFLAYGVGTTERVGWAVDAARAALRAMGYTRPDEGTL